MWLSEKRICVIRSGAKRVIGLQRDAKQVAVMRRDTQRIIEVVLFLHVRGGWCK